MKAKKETPARKTDHDTRDKLIAATVHCISEIGYSATTTTLVAQYAGVSRGALQYHFSSRQALFVAVIEHVGDSLNTSLESITSTSGNLDKRLRAICEAYLAVFQSPTYAAQIQIWLNVRNEPKLQKKIEAVVRSAAAKQDRLWGQTFADVGLSPEVVAAMRGLSVSSIRGVTLRAGNKIKQGRFPAEIDLLCRMISKFLTS